MKSSREPIELNYESFSETYAAPKVSSQRKTLKKTKATIVRALSPYRGRNIASHNFKIKSSSSSRLEAPKIYPNDVSNDDDVIYEATPQVSTGRSRSRKLSLGGALISGVVNSVVQSSRKTSRASNKRTALQGSVSDLNTEMSSVKIEESAETEVNKPGRIGILIPTVNETSALMHRGYLDRKIKRKQWGRYWCVLHNSHLACYNTQLSDVARYVTNLRGFYVIADVRNLNKTKFNFRLDHKELDAIHLSTSNHEDFLLWVGILEKETSQMTSLSERRVSERIPNRSASSLAMTSSTSHRKSSPAVQVSCHNQVVTSSSEVREHKMALLEEMTKMVGGREFPRINRDVINEDAKTRRVAFLQRRRNSTQLKLNHCTRQVSGRARSDDPNRFRAIETRLSDLRDDLKRLDDELSQEEVHTKCDLFKLQQKRDYEQLEEDSVVKELVARWQPRNRRSSNSSLPAPNSSQDFVCSTRSSASDLSELKSPEFWKRHFTADAIAADVIATDSITTDIVIIPSSPCDVTRSKRRHSSDAGVSSDGDSGFHVDDRTSGNSPYVTRNFSKVYAVTMAIIEDFENFAAKKLAETR